MKFSHHRHHNHHDKAIGDHLGLNYVTERILASVLPKRIATQQHQQQQPNLNEFNSDGPHTIDESPQDVYEQELISMLEQKHGKVNIKKKHFNMQMKSCCLCVYAVILLCSLRNSFLF